jgi:hypothetical protein
VPAEQAAELIRRLVVPDTWNKPGVMLHPAPHRLLITQTRAVHRKIAELLAQLGPWREGCSADNPCAGGGGLGGGGFGGAFQVADDPFAPRPKKAPGADPFGGPPSVPPGADPFGAPPSTPAAADPFGTTLPGAPADPFGVPAQPSAADPFGGPAKANGRPAKRNGANQPAEAAPAAQASTTNVDSQKAAPARPRKLAAQFTGHTPSVAEERIRSELDKETDVDFNEVPLREAIEYIKDKHGIEMRLDQKGLKEAALATDTPVTMNVKGITLRSALNQLLSELENDPTWVIRDDVLVITSRERAAQHKLVRIYNVSDLVQDSTAPQPQLEPPRTSYGVSAREVPYDELNSLANVVQQAVGPGTWDPAQGNSVVPHVTRRTPVLVVRHSAMAHEEVAELLRSLRDVQERQREARAGERPGNLSP